MLARQQRTLFFQALELARSGAADVVHAPSYLQRLCDALTNLAPAYGQRPPVTRIITPTQVLQCSIDMGGNITQTNDIPLLWPRPGRCYGVIATVAEGQELASRVGMSIKVNGDINVVSTGNGEGFAPLSFFSGTVEQGEVCYFPINWPVATSDRWSVAFQPTLVTSETNQTFTPLAGFLFEED